jgi:hypothetical protein
VRLAHILGGVEVGDALRLEEAVDVLERDVDVLDLVDARFWLCLVLAERVLRDDLNQLDQADAVLKTVLQVLDFGSGLLEVKVHPRGERLLLHARARRIGVLRHCRFRCAQLLT